MQEYGRWNDLCAQSGFIIFFDFSHKSCIHLWPAKVLEEIMLLPSFVDRKVFLENFALVTTTYECVFSQAYHLFRFFSQIMHTFISGSIWEEMIHQANIRPRHMLLQYMVQSIYLIF